MHEPLVIITLALVAFALGIILGPRLTGWGRHEADKAHQALHDRIEHVEKHVARLVAWSEAWDQKLADWTKQKAETTH